MQDTSNDYANGAGISAATQQLRTLAALRTGPRTTLELRRLHDILHPAARILELRERGHKIGTFWAVDLTAEGRPHRVARYVLMPRGSIVPTLSATKMLHTGSA